ncbi:MAG: metalloregulator ArsR/SmtB family transcription factor [Marinobacter sp.]|nr:metalloregulator ArsR/SmtB family transcription factor [Marinobacter sp.]
MSQPRNVLFLCTANSARSLMAEALLRSAGGSAFRVASAGTHPATPHPLALQCLQQSGFKTDTLHSKSVDTVRNQPWDYVISLCDQVTQDCQPLPGARQMLTWDFPDPAARGQLQDFYLALEGLRERIRQFIAIHQSSLPETPAYPPAEVFRLCGEERRLASLLLIAREQALCVAELTAALDLAQPAVSRYLAQLREAAILVDERQGQRVYYRLHPELPDWVRALLDLTVSANPALLAPYAMRLAAMSDRPQRSWLP